MRRRSTGRVRHTDREKGREREKVSDREKERERKLHVYDTAISDNNLLNRLSSGKSIITFI